MPTPTGPPTPSNRLTPVGGVAQREGFHAHITMANNASIAFFEKDVQPVGFEGGEPIDQTTQFNVTVRTAFPRVLYSLDPIVCNVAYSPNALGQIMSVINQNTVITVTFQDGGTICFYGWLRSFKPGPLAEGQQPMAVATFHPSNLDGNFAEQVPVETAPAGT